jgi:GT2 family glycosyltransferase
MGCGLYDLRFVPRDAPPVRDYPPEELTVIIPTYNRKPVLLRTLDALAAQTVRGFQVILVDDGSTDGTPAALHDWHQAHSALPFGFRCLRQQNMKQGVARNHGLRHATTELVLFLGDDIIPDPDFIAEHLNGHRIHNQAGDAAIIGLTEWDETTVRRTPFLDFVNYEGAQFGYNQLRPGAEAPFTCLYTSNLSLCREVLGQEPFDPRFDVYGWEDCELGLRLCSQGLRILYHPAARAVHSHHMTLSSFLKRQTQVGEALHTFIAIEPNLLILPSMSDVRRQRRTGHFGPLLAIFSPLLALLDRHARKPWPSRVYGLILSVAFGRGVLRGERRP